VSRGVVDGFERASAAVEDGLRRFWRLIAAGSSTEAAAAAVGIDRRTGLKWFAQAGGMPPLELAEPSGRYRSFSEREETLCTGRPASGFARSPGE
jgi:hypothetical protein